MVGTPEWPSCHQRGVIIDLPRYRMDLGGFKSLLKSQRRHYCAQTLGEHCFSCSRRVDHQNNKDKRQKAKGKSLMVEGLKVLKIFRVPVYLTYIGPDARWPTVIPWTGLSIGMPF